MKQTFEEFLDSKYDLINSNSNNMNPEFESARDRWYSNLDVQELIDFGQEFSEKVYLEAKEEVMGKIAPSIAGLKDMLAEIHESVVPLNPNEL